MQKTNLICSLLLILLLTPFIVFAETQNVDEWIGWSSKNTSVSLTNISGKSSMDHKYEEDQGLITSIQILSINEAVYHSETNDSYSNVTFLVKDNVIEHITMTYNKLSDISRNYYTETCGNVNQPGKYFTGIRIETDQCKGITKLSSSSIKYYTANENLCTSIVPAKVNTAFFRKDLPVSFIGGVINENGNFDVEIDINVSDLVAKILIKGTFLNDTISGNVDISLETNIDTKINELGVVVVNDDMTFTAQKIRNYDRTCEPIDYTPIPSNNSDNSDDGGGGCFINSLIPLKSR